jgi:hypothetical protein
LRDRLTEFLPGFHIELADKERGHSMTSPVEKTLVMLGVSVRADIVAGVEVPIHVVESNFQCTQHYREHLSRFDPVTLGNRDPVLIILFHVDEALIDPLA